MECFRHRTGFGEFIYMNNIQTYRTNYYTRGSGISWITLTAVRNALKKLYNQKKALGVIFAYIYES